MKSFLFVQLLLILMVATTLAYCKKEYSCEDCIDNRKPPIAIAGMDTTISLPVAGFQVDGSASYDPDGIISAYKWIKISGPSLIIDNTELATTMIRNLIPGVYKLELMVTDNDGLSSKDTVSVFINDPSIPNRPPVADAGADQLITLPVDSVKVSGAASTDPDNNITSFHWTKISGPSSFLVVNAIQSETTIKNLIPGEYLFELKVTDAGGLFSNDTMEVMVLNSAPMVCGSRPLVTASLIPAGNLSSPRMWVKGAAAGSKIIFAGGWHGTQHSPTVDIYDTITHTWSVANLTEPKRDGATIVSLGTKIFIAGGGDNDWLDLTSRVDIYDASSNTWSTQELSKPRKYLASTVIGNKILFGGGGTWDQPVLTGSDVVDIFDQSSNSWSVEHLSVGRYEVSATTAGGKVYFSGGLINTYSATTTIDIYDLATGNWTVSQLNEIKTGHTSVVVGNEIWWASGARNSYQNSYPLSERIEIRNLLTGATRFDCITPKSMFHAVKKNDHLVFFTGFSSDNRFDIYHIPSGTWSVGILPFNIAGAAVVAVNNNIYIGGGAINGSHSNQVWKLEF